MGSGWFGPIDLIRKSLESGYKGTVFAGLAADRGPAAPPVSPLPDGLGGDDKEWLGLAAAAAASRDSFFELLRMKAHFLLLPTTIITTLKDSGRVYLSEMLPAGAPAGALGATSSDSSAGTVQMVVPGASNGLAQAGYALRRNVTGLPENNFEILASIYHEMAHALFSLVVMGKLDDSDLRQLINDGTVTYKDTVALDDDNTPLNAYAAFKEAVGSYVDDKIKRWLVALSDLDILLRLKLPDGDLRQGRLQDIVNDYQKDVQVYGVVNNKIIMSPALSSELRAVIDEKILDGLTLTSVFDHTPLANLRDKILGN
jgi:hypothetical protein